jgi:hypothetical protein
MAATDLVTWPEVERVVSVSTSDHDAMPHLISAATAAIEAYIDNAMVQRAFTEDYSGGVKPWLLGGAKRIKLRKYPIVSVASITDDDSNTVAATDYTVVADLGWLEHDGTWPRPVGRWTIVYTAGRYADTASVAADVKQAAIRVIRAWLSGRAPDVESVTVGPVTERYRSAESGLQGGLPGDVEAALAPYRSRGV